jgi:SAM-dependent methyltransferase
MDLTEQERAKYCKTWANKDYRVVSPGMRHLAGALDWMKPEPGASFTDWGCGTGRAAAEMAERGFDVRLVDIASNAYAGPLPFVESCLWELPADMPATDYGFCADVMEHIPTERVDDVLAGIAARTRRKAYFQIALFHDSHFTDAGPLHLSVFPAEWWQARIARHFKVAEYRKIRLKHLLVVAE